MKSEIQGKIKYGFWGFICGSIIAMIIGFNWGGWTTSSTTQKMNVEAVLASQSAICVAQVMKDPSRLKKFGELESWKRSELIEKGGWDKMPGQAEASSGVARACVAGIEALIKI